MEFGDRLRVAREAAKLTQSDLAALVPGLKQKAISKLETGERKSSRSTVQLARALGVRAEWLANGEEPMRPEAPVHEGQGTRSRFRGLDEGMLLKAETYALIAEALEGVEYPAVVYNRYLLDAYAIIEVNKGEFPAKAHDEWISNAQARRQQRETHEQKPSTPK